jgi:hypothetical protein
VPAKTIRHQGEVEEDMDQTLQGLLTQNLDRTALPAGQSQEALQTLLASQIKDPLMASMFAAMLQNGTADRASEEEPREAYRRTLKGARRKIKRLEAHLESANLMVGYFSQVFGACPHCLGLDETCPACHGRGQPGSFQPVEEELLSWVMPALSRLSLSVTRNGRPRSDTRNRISLDEKEQNNE